MSRSISNTCLRFLCVVSATFFSRCLFSQREYIDEVLKIVETNSVRKDSVDFSKIRSEAYSKLHEGMTQGEVHAVVRFILSELNDHHSILLEKSKVDAWKAPVSIVNETQSSKYFSGRMATRRIAYISMTGFSSGDTATVVEYATRLQNLIRSLDNKRIQGWILDLRENEGGNCWPMLAGLGPLLGEGTCGYFVSNGNVRTSWYYKDGAAGATYSGHDSPVCAVQHSPYHLINPSTPIAVLTGWRTVSSGEVVTTAFRGRPNAKSFGQNTGGLSTGNSPFFLSDGAVLILTTSIYADRSGKMYGGKIAPDVQQSFAYASISTKEDEVIKRAISWIRRGR